MKILSYKYPKLALFLLSIVLSYFIFRNEKISLFFSQLGDMSYLSVFIAGIFFSFGFTTAFAIGIFVFTNPENIFLASIIGGVGSVLGDLLIFRLIRISFMSEFKNLEHGKIFRYFKHVMNQKVSHKIKIYLLYVFAGLVLASPLPDEIGVLMLAGLTKIKESFLAIISFVLHTLGILIIFVFASL